jgi:hypothetical protein
MFKITPIARKSEVKFTTTPTFTFTTKPLVKKSRAQFIQESCASGKTYQAAIREWDSKVRQYAR